MFQPKTRTLPAFLALFGALALGACSSSGSGEADGFQLTLISVPEGETSWQINRPIEFRFNQPVDFSTVNLNSIQIRRLGGSPATGEFSLKQERITTEVGGQVIDETITLEDVVVFQPTCPKEPSPFPDAGFLPGGVVYEIRVVGADTGEDISIQAMDGRTLATGQVRRFSTPDSTDEVDVFQDPRQGPPQPVVRGSGLTPVDEMNATHIEIGGEGGERRYFELDTDAGEIGEVLNVPLNLYSEQTGKVALVVVIDQPVDPSPANISSSRLKLEFLDELSEWQAVTTNVELVANCTEQGAELRIEPVGILPPTSSLRVNISPQFRDIRGDSNLLPVTTFARFQTRAVQGNVSADELKEDFVVSGSSFNSFEDTESAFPTQRAAWGEGSLKAAFGFEGTGGPGGDFDYTLPLNKEFQFNTTSQPISNSLQTKSQVVVGGIVQVRDFTLSAGSRFQVIGPNPLVIFATGDVRIDGSLDASGFRAQDVQSLLLAQVPQSGGIGTAGGGSGGTGSPLTSSSSPRGGPGAGAFNVKGLGGEGGETGYAPTDRNWRRPGGGGAGVFGPNEGGEPSGTAPENGLKAQPGFDGFDSTHPGFATFNPVPTGSFGAESGGDIPARGGAVGPSPFLDANEDNNFWGVRFDALGDATIGELPTPWAGAGGGGGGDALRGTAFPSPTFINPNDGLTSNDYKGGAGGGGGGSVHILALGTISFGPAGEILVNGGVGGTGESTNFLDQIGGGGGGGSGGHVILESNTGIDFTEVDLSGGTPNVVSARGGKGALGLPLVDTGEGTGEFIKIFNVLERRVNEGGTGGPGLVQLHVPGATLAEQETNIALPGAATLGQLTAPDALVMVPSFGTRSRAQSEWVALGGASPASGATDTNPTFLFDGTDGLSPDPGGGLDTSMVGFVETSGSKIADLDPIYSSVLDEVDGDAGQVTVTIAGIGDPPDAGELSNRVYRNNPELLVDFRVILERNGVERKFVVAAASRQGTTLTLTLTGNASLSDFTAGDSIDIIPRFFRVVTTVDGDEEDDTLPAGQEIQIQFQAAALADDGGPDETDLLVDWTGNIEDLNDAGLVLPPAFFRFAVIFDTGAISSATPRPTLEFLRMPFEFSGPND